jgi:hypothetical protein
MPERLQRRRTPGWTKPPGAVCVTRLRRGHPGPYGNPYVVAPMARQRSVSRSFARSMTTRCLGRGIGGSWPGRTCCAGASQGRRAMRRSCCK